jgi:hypothetical protein
MNSLGKELTSTLLSIAIKEILLKKTEIGTINMLWKGMMTK